MASDPDLEEIYEIDNFFDSLYRARMERRKDLEMDSSLVSNFVRNNPEIGARMIAQFGAGVQCETAIEVFESFKNLKNDDPQTTKMITEELFIKYIDNPKEWMIECCFEMTSAIIRELERARILRNEKTDI